MLRTPPPAGAAWLACFLLGAGHCGAAEDLEDRIRGDVGAAIYADRSPIRSVATPPHVLPYAFFDYGRFFARLDTLGVKTVPLGYGYLELAARIKFDGYPATALRGIDARANSLPVGIGTFQLTPIGGFFLNAFHDFNLSHGDLYEILYAAEVDLGRVVLYPQAGMEHYSGAYTRYYYGISSAEAAASGYPAYAPGAATIPSLGLVVQIGIQGNWYSNVYLRRRWLDAAITRSPLVDTKFQDTGFVSLNYRYE